jgi:hypothetical protein
LFQQAVWVLAQSLKKLLQIKRQLRLFFSWDYFYIR